MFSKIHTGALEVDTEATMLSWLVVKLFGLVTLSTNFAKCGQEIYQARAEDFKVVLGQGQQQ